MPNTQTSVPAFTAGQVLTAQQMMDVNTGIPVFATTTTRDAAFGGTGEKTLAEGQFAYIEASNTTQYYDGAAWQTLGGGLTLVKTQTVGTAVSSVQVTDAFSSTYDNYLLTYNNGTSSAVDALNVQMGATTSGYYATIIGTTWSATFSGVGSTTSTSFERAGEVNSVNGPTLFLQVQSPFLSKRTRVQGQYLVVTGGYIFVGMLDNTTSYTAFTLIPATGTLTGGTIRVYGYQNS